MNDHELFDYESKEITNFLLNNCSLSKDEVINRLCSFGYFEKIVDQFWSTGNNQEILLITEAIKTNHPNLNNDLFQLDGQKILKFVKEILTYKKLTRPVKTSDDYKNLLKNIATSYYNLLNEAMTNIWCNFNDTSYMKIILKHKGEVFRLSWSETARRFLLQFFNYCIDHGVFFSTMTLKKV